jgi:hypothetical protein
MEKAQLLKLAVPFMMTLFMYQLFKLPGTYT